MYRCLWWKINKKMKKQFLTKVMLLSFVLISAFSIINISYAQENKCGDNVCDEFERANPSACPKDCLSVQLDPSNTPNDTLPELKTAGTITYKTFNKYNYPILYPIVNKVSDVVEENLFLTIWIPFLLTLIFGELFLKKGRRVSAFFSPVSIYFIYLVMISFTLGSDGALAGFLLLMYMSVFLPINYIILALRFLLKYRKSIRKANKNK